jgi:hypothetical protein
MDRHNMMSSLRGDQLFNTLNRLILLRETRM